MELEWKIGEKIYSGGVDEFVALASLRQEHLRILRIAFKLGPQAVDVLFNKAGLSPGFRSPYLFREGAVSQDTSLVFDQLKENITFYVRQPDLLAGLESLTSIEVYDQFVT